MINITKSKMNLYTYREWTDYFAKNDTRRLSIDFSGEKPLTEEEKKLIFPSMRAFQKGEGSDGVFLMRTVEEFVQKSGEKEYAEAMLWFVKEENWHSAYLRKYMDFYKVEVLENSGYDHIFRRLRQLGGLRCEVTVLVTAEMIALTYYDALSRCVDSPALRSICAQMLEDELPHIMFQSYTLSHFQNRLPDKLLRIFFMKATLLMVWGAFHRVYRAGGYGFYRYIKENMGYLRQSIYLADNRGGKSHQ